MNKFLSILFIFPLIASSIDETYFENSNKQCVCAVKPNQCNPYCACDPFCTDDQKKEFSFYLPESFSNSKISCDPKKRISKVNLKSIKEELPNCYSIEGKEDGKKIINYDSKNFGIENFNEAVDSPLLHNVFQYNANDTYKKGDILIGHGVNNQRIQPFYLPIAIGSSTSNALIPIRFRTSYPSYNSRVDSRNPLSFVSQLSLVRDVYTPSGRDEIAEYELFSSLNDNIQDGIDGFLTLQYIFRVEDDDNDPNIYNITMKRLPAAEVKSFPSSYMVFTFEVFFGSNVNFFDNIYQNIYMGYYYGTPLMIDENEKNYMSYSELFSDSRKPLQILNKTNVLFGVNSTIVVDLADISDYKKDMFPSHTRIYKSYGHIICELENGDDYFVKFNRSNIHEDNNSLKYAIARWTFYYRKFNNETNPVYILQSLNTSFSKPVDQSNIKGAMIKIEFIEIDENGKLKVEEEIRFHHQSYSAIFDVFFRDPSESLNTIGVLFCFALMGTLWCWYVCFFYIED